MWNVYKRSWFFGRTTLKFSCFTQTVARYERDRLGRRAFIRFEPILRGPLF